MANIRVVPLWACQRGLKKIKKKKKKKKKEAKTRKRLTSQIWVMVMFVQFLSYTKVKQVCLKLLIILLPVYILKEL